MEVTVSGGKWNCNVLAEQDEKKYTIFMRLEEETVSSIVLGWLLRKPEQNNPKKNSYFLSKQRKIVRENVRKE